ncbi:MAG: ABC transporter permease [Planctomycetota bacterium]
MSQIFTMAIKDLRLLFRDKLGAFFIIGFPILMGLFFGTITGNYSSGTGKKSQIKVAIVDQDKTDVSEKFVSLIQQNDSVDCTPMEFDPARESVRKGSRVAMIVLGEGFGETAGFFWEEAPSIQIGVDPSRNAESAMLQGFIMETIGQLSSERMQDSMAMQDMIDRSKDQLKADQEISVANRLLVSTFLNSLEGMVDSIDALQTESDDTIEGPGGGSGFQFANIESIDVTRKIDPNSVKGQLMKTKSKWDVSFPQAMMWGILACVAGFAGSIAKERTHGTMTRLQVAPISKFQVLCGKALACFISVMIVVAMMTGLGVALDMRPDSYPKLILSTFCVAGCFVGIMMVMSNLGKTEESVNGSGWAINMVMAMLGGGMIPVMFMPSFMQSLSHFSPVKWSVLAVEGAIWREFSYAELLMPCGILVGIGIAGVLLGSWMMRRS